ncbi:MAG: bifunctional folylpolyglutamate synthase/dihydrofolate synthase [Desulfovibrio sp.]|nr:MAG: bifunctional folylpolyglutamate synthase/dihydrofolate synthase [Desulfovibrio sp.]
MNAFANSQEFESFLADLGLFHMDLGLGRIGGCLANLGLDSPGYAIVQVVGTNGKGSSSAYLAALAQAHGVDCGLFSSPHFLSPRERIKVRGSVAEEGVWLEAANTIHESQAEPQTYFEYLTAMAAWIFRKEQVRVAVFEAGLGGTHDATSALPAGFTLFTPVALDHCGVLGDTLTAIARDKAGAMQQGGRALSAPQPSQVMLVLEDEARAKQVDFQRMDSPGIQPAWTGDALPKQAAGTYLEDNARLAVAAWNRLAQDFGVSAEPDACTQALDRAALPGRLQHIAREPDQHPELVLDGAHNPSGLAALKKSLAALGIEPKAVIFTCMEDKDLPAMAEGVRALTKGPVIVPDMAHVERSRPAHEVAAALGRAAITALDMDHALRLALAACKEPDHTALVCGSLYLLADFFTLRPLLVDF